MVNLNAGDNIPTNPSGWTFNDSTVVSNFDDHVSKSVPLYTEVHDLCTKLSDFFLVKGSSFLDIGCSTGNLISSIHQRHISRSDISFIGIDPSSEMISSCLDKHTTSSASNLSFLNSSFLDYEVKSANFSFISSIYTFQFIPPHLRQDCFDKVYSSLMWSGAFLLFEKVRAPDARFQDMMSQVYIEHKIDQGYSPTEILAKSRSLKGVLEPFSSSANVDYLKRAGFSDVMSVFKYCSFEGFLAIK